MTTCATGAHTCRWRDVSDQVDALLEAYDRCETLASLRQRFSVDTSTIKAVLLAHGVRIRSTAEQRRRKSDLQASNCTNTVHHCPWAKEHNVEAILAAYARNDSRRQVGRDFCIAPDTVGRILKAHGVSRRSRQQQTVRVTVDLEAVAQARRNGVPMGALADGAGLTRQALTHRLQTNGYTAQDLQPKPCTPGKHTCRWARTLNVEDLLTRYAADASQRELGMRFSVTAGTVGRILDAHGVARRTASDQLVTPETARRRRSKRSRGLFA